ncbi:MAG: Uma2 family endonuclease [Roseiflexaceae bacterium]|nr:Uma2 family endonuclease [Roseiflexaceae bacterium]
MSTTIDDLVEHTITIKLPSKQPIPAWEVALLFPPQGAWSKEEYLALTDSTNNLVEYTQGQIEVLPMPTEKHQRILEFIFFIVRELMHSTGGRAFFSPLRLYIEPDRYREPDILLVVDKHDPRRADRYWSGADLVVEIVSPDNPERDWVQKRADYARAGIPEYWIVDPQQERIAVLRLDGDVYAEHGLFTRGEIATSVLLPDLRVDVTAALDAE